MDTIKIRIIIIGSILLLLTGIIALNIVPTKTIVKSFNNLVIEK